MKIGIISDAHGNYFGTEMCLSFLKNKLISKLFFLGDAVGYFPDVNKVIDILVANNATMLMGNHDAMLLGLLPLDEKKDKVYRITDARKIISSDNCQRLKSLPLSYEFDTGRKKLLFVHASPWSPLSEYIYPDSDLTKFINLECDVFFLGHTHYPFVLNKGPKTIINVGSCGSPRDVGILSSCCIYDTDTDICTIYRLQMDKATIVNSYSDRTDESVINLLNRVKNNYFGELVINQ